MYVCMYKCLVCLRRDYYDYLCSNLQLAITFFGLWSPGQLIPLYGAEHRQPSRRQTLWGSLSQTPPPNEVPPCVSSSQIWLASTTSIYLSLFWRTYDTTLLSWTTHAWAHTLTTGKGAPFFFWISLPICDEKRRTYLLLYTPATQPAEQPTHRTQITM